MATLFKLSEGANLALHAMMVLAANPERPLDTVLVAERLGASAHHLAKILQRLNRAGLLQSVRGPKGGFRLARAPESIHLLEIYEAVEGPVETRYCLFDLPRCPAKKCCGVGEYLGRTGEEFRKLLEEQTLAAVASRFHGLQKSK